MAIRIKFDENHNVCTPTFTLATRSGRKLGAIPAREISVKDGMNTYSELFFSVSKEENGVKYHLWDKLKDFKLMWCKEWDTWFELSVEIDESNSLIKNVSAKSLGESELSQINLYGIEINTEDDILRDDYEPTVLFNESYPNASLLNRIMEKAPHYRIAHVDTSIKNIQRQFSFDNKSIYDSFQEIATEIDCIFIIEPCSDGDGHLDRKLSVYDLESYCINCGHRDNFVDVCPECGSNNIFPGYGNDTTIFVSTDNLADNIKYSTDCGSVKNCFKLAAGDDLMTATIISCNPNGSPYVWYISDEVKEDMSDALVAKIDEYDERYKYYQEEHITIVPEDLRIKYNELIDKYSVFSSDLAKIPNNIIGYPTLMTTYYNTVDFYLFLNHSLMPNIEMQDTSAIEEVAKLNLQDGTSVAVQDLSKVSTATASSAVLSLMKVIIDSRYQVKIGESSFTDATDESPATWQGNFVITNYSDDEDIATSDRISILITDNYEEFVKQKLDKALGGRSEEATDIAGLFKLSQEEFIIEIKKYSLSRLRAFYDSCQMCLNVLIEQGVADRDTWAEQDPDLYTEIYLDYYNKSEYLSEEIQIRESEIAIIVGLFDEDNRIIADGMQTIIDAERATINSELNFEDYLGESLWLEFVAYRREDTYQNDNYISDGLDNAQLFANALEFIDVAKKDIFKSATLQHSISATLKNLLVMKEFSPIVDYFEVGNWIRIQVDGKIYKLRILDYKLCFDELDNISVTFSDVKIAASGINDVESVLNQASSMASSYGSISRQAGQGQKSKDKLDDWVTNGLALTNMKIVDGAKNQNITIDSNGLLGREYLPITDSYDDKQLKLINRGIYLTDDNWRTSRAGIGEFSFYNPQSGEMESTYGVIADTLVGNLILSEKVGIYNTKNSITLNENGVIITTNGDLDTDAQIAFTIQKNTIIEDDDGNPIDIITPIMYVDDDGNLVLNGTIRVNSSNNVSTLDDIADETRLDQRIKQEIHNYDSTIAQTSIEKSYQEAVKYASDQLNGYKSEVGQYLNFDSENGLTIGSTSGSGFTTVIDNKRMAFKDGTQTVSYISNQQLNIIEAVIETNLILGNLYFSPRFTGEGEEKVCTGVSLTWQEKEKGGDE